MDVSAVRRGRAHATTASRLSRVALALFMERGFDEVTIDEIARTAGIARRTFFHYFPSKNDLLWGDFDHLVDDMALYLQSLPASSDLVSSLRLAVLEFNRFPADEEPYHRRRMEVLLTTPTLIAHSTLRHSAWREVIATFSAARLGMPSDSLRPQLIARVCLSITLCAYEQWLADGSSDILTLISEGFGILAVTFADSER